MDPSKCSDVGLSVLICSPAFVTRERKETNLKMATGKIFPELGRHQKRTATYLAFENNAVLSL